MADGFDVLRARGAPERLLQAMAAAGLPGDAARGAVEAGWRNRLRLALRRRPPLSDRERERLEAVARLAAAVAVDEGDAQAASRFWSSPIPWLDGRTPAACLARGDIDAINELRVRINYGIPP